MVKSLFLGIIFLIVFGSIQTSFAEKVEDVEALTDKAITLSLDKKYEEALNVFLEVLDKEPDNPEAMKWIPKMLNEIPTESTMGSDYLVHIQLIVKNEDEKIISVLESTNSRYLPVEFLEFWWSTLIDRGIIIQEDGIERLQVTFEKKPTTDHIGSFSYEAEIAGKAVKLFETYLPMMEFDGSENLELQWTIIK